MSRGLWVIVAVRLIGLLSISIAAPVFIQMLYGTIERMLTIGLDVDVVRLFLFFWIGPASQFALGVYLLFFGKRVVRWCLRGLDGKCPRCGYDLQGVRGDVCPECGLRSAPAEGSRASETA